MEIATSLFSAMSLSLLHQLNGPHSMKKVASIMFDSFTRALLTPNGLTSWCRLTVVKTRQPQKTTNHSYQKQIREGGTRQLISVGWSTSQVKSTMVRCTWRDSTCDYI